MKRLAYRMSALLLLTGLVAMAGPSPASADPGSSGAAATAARLPARILVGQGSGSCPRQYACFWEAAHFTGRGVGFLNNEPTINTLPPAYRFINDTASSVYNNGTSGMQIRMCEHPRGGGRCISLARGWTFPDLSHPALAMNDTISSMQWFWG